MGKEIRLLQIGHGYWGSKLLERFTGLVGAKNIWLAELDSAKVPVYFDGTRLGSNYENMLYMVDACVVATPISTHYEIAKKCLEAGKHVLLEKPMATKSLQAWELMRIAQSKNLTFMVDDTFLYSERLQDIHTPSNMYYQMINPPVVGKHFNAEWSNWKEHLPPEGLWWTLGPHPVSVMLRYFIEKLPNQVRVVEASPWVIHVWYKFLDGEAQILLNWLNPLKRRMVNHVEFGSLDAPGSDALSNVCSEFIGRIEHPWWVDLHSARVVMVMEWTQKRLEYENPPD